MKKNTFKTEGYLDRFKTVDSTLKFIEGNIYDGADELSPIEKQKQEAARRYNELKDLAKTPSSLKENLKVFQFIITYRSAFLSFAILFFFCLYVYGLFMLLNIISK